MFDFFNKKKVADLAAKVEILTVAADNAAAEYKSAKVAEKKITALAVVYSVEWASHWVNPVPRSTFGNSCDMGKCDSGYEMSAGSGIARGYTQGDTWVKVETTGDDGAWRKPSTEKFSVKAEHITKMSRISWHFGIDGALALRL